MADLQDKVVLVTGAGAGIGRATALAMARDRSGRWFDPMIVGALDGFEAPLAEWAALDETGLRDAVRAAGHKIYVATKVPPKNRVWPAQPGTPIGDVVLRQVKDAVAQSQLLENGGADVASQVAISKKPSASQ